MDFDICCFELASLDVLISADSRFKPVGGEIWYPCSAKRAVLRKESAGAKKQRFFGVRKNAIFSASEKMTFFSGAQPDVVDHPETIV